MHVQVVCNVISALFQLDERGLHFKSLKNALHIVNSYVHYYAEHETMLLVGGILSKVRPSSIQGPPSHLCSRLPRIIRRFRTLAGLRSQVERATTSLYLLTSARIPVEQVLSGDRNRTGAIRATNTSQKEGEDHRPHFFPSCEARAR